MSLWLTLSFALVCMDACMRAHFPDRSLFPFCLSSFSLPYIAPFLSSLDLSPLSLHTARLPLRFPFRYTRTHPLILCHARRALCTHALTYSVPVSVLFKLLISLLDTILSEQCRSTSHLAIQYYTRYVCSKAFVHTQVLVPVLGILSVCYFFPSFSCEHSCASPSTSFRACRSHAVFLFWEFWRHLVVRSPRLRVSHFAIVRHCSPLC